MAQRELNEFEQIMEHIHNKHNFLLSGGAGSGKTYSLVRVIRQIIDEYPSAKVACMTYTNAAVKEIEERVNHKNLYVTTIHDFLWDNIKNFQSELKQALIQLANDPDETKINIENATMEMFEEMGIRYMEKLSLKKGIISHDELLIVAEYLFKNYKKLCDIVKNKSPFILIDEYQDTNETVVKIFLEHLKQSEKENIIGFFGDSMQSIYDNTIGNLDNYKGNENHQVREVKKEQNRRNPELIIELANKLRIDGLVQQPQFDKTNPHPPNMNGDGTIKQGEILFLHSINYDLNKVRDYLGWNFKEKDRLGNLICKELNLTHNLIAKQALFTELMDIYNNDQIITFKNKVVKHLKDKPEIEIDENDTFGQVIEKTGQSPSNGRMSDFINANSVLFEEAKQYNFATFRNIYLGSDVLTDDKKQEESEESKKGSKRDNLLRHLFKIQGCIRLYSEKNYNEFLRKVSFKINSIDDKQLLKDRIDELSQNDGITIGEVINKADEYQIIAKDDKLLDFIDRQGYVYDRVCKVKYAEFINVYNYLEGYTPFSTQHKTKGNEFDNVLVILDNGRWNNFNFDYLFTNRTDKATVLSRTQKIFYVCCTRAKEKLAVYFNSPSTQVLETAIDWFGTDNVINLEE
jgi:DNA helicase II / ATP-dependent DNA helicase PcrA